MISPFLNPKGCRIYLFAIVVIWLIGTFMVKAGL